MRGLLGSVLICCFVLAHFVVASPIGVGTDIRTAMVEQSDGDSCDLLFEQCKATPNDKATESRDNPTEQSDCPVDCVHAFPVVNISVHRDHVGYELTTILQLFENPAGSHRPPPKRV